MTSTQAEGIKRLWALHRTCLGHGEALRKESKLMGWRGEDKSRNERDIRQAVELASWFEATALEIAERIVRFEIELRDGEAETAKLEDLFGLPSVEDPES